MIYTYAYVQYNVQVDWVFKHMRFKYFPYSDIVPETQLEILTTRFWFFSPICFVQTDNNMLRLCRTFKFVLVFTTLIGGRTKCDAASLTTVSITDAPWFPDGYFSNANVRISFWFFFFFNLNTCKFLWKCHDKIGRIGEPNGLPVRKVQAPDCGQVYTRFGTYTAQ